MVVAVNTHSTPAGSATWRRQVLDGFGVPLSPLRASSRSPRRCRFKPDGASRSSCRGPSRNTCCVRDLFQFAERSGAGRSPASVVIPARRRIVGRNRSVFHCMTDDAKTDHAASPSAMPRTSWRAPRQPADRHRRGHQDTRLALSDVTRTITGVETIRRTSSRTMRSVCSISRGSMRSRIQPACRPNSLTAKPRGRRQRAFARNPTAASLAEPALDERLTTVEAERMLIAADTSRNGARTSSTSSQRRRSCRGAPDRMRLLRADRAT